MDGFNYEDVKHVKLTEPSVTVREHAAVLPGNNSLYRFRQWSGAYFRLQRNIIIDWVIEWRFYAQNDTKYVISETFFPANPLA